MTCLFNCMNQQSFQKLTFEVDIIKFEYEQGMNEKLHSKPKTTYTNG